MIIQGRTQEFLMGGGGLQTLVQKGLFCGKLLLSYTPQAHTPSHQSRLHVVTLSLAPYRVLLWEQRRTDHKRVPKNNYIF